MTSRDRLAAIIGSFPLHTDDRGDENQVLHDAFSGDSEARTEAVYQLVDDVLAEVSAGIDSPTNEEAPETCPRCQGNGEIVTDWDRYLGPSQPGDEGDEGTAECTDCGGTGITYQTERRCACQPSIANPPTS